MARIFICGDTGLGPMLDTVAGILAAEGHAVVRGEPNAVGSIKHYTPAERAAWINDADVAVFTARHRCDRELLAGASRLRGVCYPVIGIETLDIDAADALGIIVGHGAVRATVIGMAESTVMLMLMLFYDMRANMARIEAGEWRRPQPGGRQIEGKTIGLIGFGRIAGEVARRLSPFGTSIITYAPYTSENELPQGVRKVNLATLMRKSDLVSVLTGLTPETYHMIGRDQLAMMKADALLVNTGRGAVIDEVALVEHLAAGRIAGAALDTFTVEPLPLDSPLRRLPNVVLTPHAVGHTAETIPELIPAMAENIRRIITGRLPLHCANPGTEGTWRQRLVALDAAAVPAPAPDRLPSNMLLS